MIVAAPAPHPIRPQPSALAAADALAPVIAARAEEIDAARRLPADLARRLAEAGLFRVLLPRELGGAELAPAEAVRVFMRLAEESASVAWCVMIAATTSLSAARMDPAVARLIWGDPLAITGGVFAPRGTAVREGDVYRVSGRWAWASGSANCAWLGAGAVVEGEGPASARLMWLPAAEVELIDTWRTLGLRGTGSGDMAVVDARVPVERAVSLTLDAPRIERALYRFPIFGLLAVSVASVALGNARGALDAFAAFAAAKTPSGSSRPLALKATTQVAFAEAEAIARAARAGLLDACDAAFETASARDLDVAARAGLRIAAAHAARAAADVVRRLHDLAGGSSVYDDEPLQRRFRDAHVATQHVMVSSAALELAGRALLGVEADWSQL